MKRMQIAAVAALLALGLCGCMAGNKAPAEPADESVPSVPATPEPTATPAPIGNPLTGAGGDFTGKRPVAVALRTGEGTSPQWGVAAADVLVEGVTVGNEASLTALFADAAAINKVGPIEQNHDLMLQMTLPLNAVQVSINKSVYASNLLNLLSYQDIDGYHIGTAAFAFDEERYAAGYREENCWYTTADLINNGLSQYGMTTGGDNMTLFYFEQRPEPEARNGTDLFITFSGSDTEELVYTPETAMYLKNNADGSPAMDANTNDQAAFTNVIVLYASSGVKDDGVTRQYDMNGGTGLYLTGGAWQQINWTKGDATAPLALTDLEGKTLSVNPGKTFIAVWGGYYGQSLRLLAEDGTEQSLPEKPALLESGITDEAAQAAEEEIRKQQEILEIQQALAEAQATLETAVEVQTAAAATEDPADDEAAAAQTAAAQAEIDRLQARLNELAPPPTETPAPEEAPAEEPAGEGEAQSFADGAEAPATEPAPEQAAEPAPEQAAEPAAEPAPAEEAPPPAEEAPAQG